MEKSPVFCTLVGYIDIFASSKNGWVKKLDDGHLLRVRVRVRLHSLFVVSRSDVEFSYLF